jgi:hypothetical protein
MYRDAVDQGTRDDIATAAAVHRELGRDYDDAVAEGLVDRIGAEIDKRIEAQLGSPPSHQLSPMEMLRRSGREVTEPARLPRPFVPWMITVTGEACRQAPVPRSTAVLTSSA